MARTRRDRKSLRSGPANKCQADSKVQPLSDHENATNDPAAQGIQARG
ncbi:hypothetical protein Thi970DRAFT_03233 [Thiorhodovibrio frisius]|uniref:Uncharacterized protein n=1 Tax=Thiorhodovibrio frisius TaxID=631362 RepID=H8Z677_9GAMM|nr:hypothetical protein Thi970DRAFT_03233 [Thiorhodovibrio frisius]WPL20389.1 hypothetical protein Thiofri_00477 [Thiorhodovibrio frisius]